MAVLAAGCGSTNAAISLGGESVSRSDFESSLEYVFENDGVRSLIFGGEVPADRLRAEGDPRGSFTQAYAGALSGIFVEYLLADQIADELGVEVSDQAREEVEGQLEDAAGGDIDDVPDGLRRRYVDGQAALATLDLDSEEVQAEADRLVGDVEVSSRYGSWDRDQFTVVPPAGPRPAPGAEEAPAELSAG